MARDFSSELKAAIDAGDWAAHDRISDAHRHAEVAADEAAKRPIIQQACETADADEAIKIVATALGIKNHDLAEYHMPNGESWARISIGARASHIGFWLTAECEEVI